MDRRHLLLGLALAALPQLAQAETKPPVPLNKVFGYLDKYLALPPTERNRFTLNYQFRMDGKPASGLKGDIIEADGRHTPILLGPDGRARTLPTLAQLKTATLKMDVPPGTKMGVALEVVPLLPLSQQITARDLELSVAQAGKGISAVAGVLSFAAPKLTGVSFVGAGSGTLRYADGKEAPLPVAKGNPYYDVKLAKGAVSVTLAKAPSKVEFRDS
jgi:hypothetical protein